MEIWYFLQVFWKDRPSKKLGLEYDLFLIIRKDYISISGKHYLILYLLTSNLYIKIFLYHCKLYCTKNKFSIKEFFSKCEQIRSFLRIWSHLLTKSLMENFIFCAVLRFLQMKSVQVCAPQNTGDFIGRPYLEQQRIWKNCSISFLERESGEYFPVGFTENNSSFLTRQVFF